MGAIVLPYKCEHFGIKELVSVRAFNEKGERCWRFLNPETIWTADRLRKRYGPSFCNTWGLSDRIQAAYGTHQFRGLRLPGELSRSSDYSGHRHGKSLDQVFAEVTAEEVRQDILADPDHEDFQYITELELGVSWLHYACGTNVERILTYHP